MADISESNKSCFQISLMTSSLNDGAGLFRIVADRLQGKQVVMLEIGPAAQQVDDLVTHALLSEA